MTGSDGYAQIARVAIVGGTGALGLALATALGRAGTEVVITSRDPDRARRAAEQLTDTIPDGRFHGAANAEAALQADVVIVSVPFAGHAEIVRTVADTLHPGQLVIDTTVPLAPAVGGKATRVLGVWQGSAVQQTAELLPPGVDLVAALHTVSATLLASDGPMEQDVLLCGDVKEAKRRAAGLLERVPGLRCIDCGRLEQSRITEQITALLIGINIRYKTHAGLRITGLQGA